MFAVVDRAADVLIVVAPPIAPPVMLTAFAFCVDIVPNELNVVDVWSPSCRMTDIISRIVSLTVLGYMPSGAPTGGGELLSAGVAE